MGSFPEEAMPKWILDQHTECGLWLDCSRLFRVQRGHSQVFLKHCYMMGGNKATSHKTSIPSFYPIHRRVSIIFILRTGNSMKWYQSNIILISDKDPLPIQVVNKFPWAPIAIWGVSRQSMLGSGIPPSLYR